MLPPALAALSFVDPELGSDLQLGKRAAGAQPGARVALLGASRPGLTRALAAHGLRVVVLDTSRAALRRAQDELRPGDDVLLLIADPREFEIPGGVDGILVPSAPWRAIVPAADRRRVLRAMARELRPGGSLLLDLERLPPPPASWARLPDAPLPRADSGDSRWRAGPSDDTCVVATPGTTSDVTFATFTPETAIDEALGEGFADASSRDAGTGDTADASTQVIWARLRTRRGPS